MKNAKVHLYEKVSCLDKIWNTTQDYLLSGLKSCWHKIVFHVRTSLGNSYRLDSGTCLPSSYVMIQTHCYFFLTALSTVRNGSSVDRPLYPSTRFCGPQISHVVCMGLPPTVNPAWEKCCPRSH